MFLENKDVRVFA